MDKTDTQTLIETYDSKMSNHISAIIAITFGAFSLLTLLAGQISQIFNPSVFYIFLLDVLVFPLAITYCFARSAHYSHCAELARQQSSLVKISDKLTNTATDQIAKPIARVIKIRKKISVEKIVWLLPIIWALWIILIVSVMSLPNSLA